MYPLVFRLEYPRPIFPVWVLGVIGSSRALGDGIADEAVNRGVCELTAAAGAISSNMSFRIGASFGSMRSTLSFHW